MIASPVTADITHELPVDEISGSTLNPRSLWDAEELQQLADSIKSHGLIEPIVVRPADHATFNGPKESTKYTVVAGERRLRAAHLAGLHTITAIVRTDLTDQQALEVTILENLQRRQLAPMDESAAFASLKLHCGMKPAAIATAIHRSKDSILEGLHRLDLPTAVQDQLRTGELSPTAARGLWRYRNFPDFLTKLAAYGQKQGWKPTDYEKPLGEQLRYFYAGDHILPMVPVTDNYYDGATPKHEACKKCPFGARFGHWCINPPHMAELDKAADKERATRIRAATKEAKKHGTTVVDLSTLGYADYHDLRFATKPAGCTDDCPCRAQGVDKRTQELISICTDPKHWRSLQTQQTKADNAQKREAQRKASEELAAAVDRITSIGATELALIACTALKDLTRAEANKALRHAHGLIPAEGRPFTSHEGRKNLAPDLAQLDPLDIVKLAVEAICRCELEDAYNGYMGVASIRLTPWLTTGAVPARYEPFIAPTPKTNRQATGDDTTPEEVLDQWTSTDQQRTRILDWAEHQGITDAGILEETLHNQPTCTTCDPTAPMGADEECPACVGTGIDLTIPAPATT